jgi:hypothetical protein
MDEKKTPIIKIRGDGGFSVAVFADMKKRSDETEYVSYSAVLQKSWKDKNDQWQQQSVSMFDNNLPNVALLLQKVASAIMDLRNNAQPPATQQQPAVEKTNAQAIDELSDSVPF